MLVDELGIRRGAVRVDLAVVNGVLHGVELKSDDDRLTRLPHQAIAYSEVMDRATLVVTEKHFAYAAAVVPDWWELIVALREGRRTRLEVRRRGENNPCVDARALAELVWREEALALLHAHAAAKGLGSATCPVLWDRLCEVITLDELRDVVRRLVTNRAAKRAVRERT